MKTTLPAELRRGRLLFLAVLLGGFALDLWTKAWAFEFVEARTPYAPDRYEVIEGFFYLERVENPGAMWSLFQGLPRWFWIVVRGGVFCVILAIYWSRVQGRWWVHLAFGLVLAGACGNIHDNLFAPGGRVRDFLKLVFWGWPFPTFNVADSMITVGAVLLVFHFLGADGRRGEAR